MDPNQHGRFNDETYVTMAKICELFIEDVTRRAWTKAKQYGGSTIESNHMVDAIVDVVAGIPIGDEKTHDSPNRDDWENKSFLVKLIIRLHVLLQISYKCNKGLDTYLFFLCHCTQLLCQWESMKYISMPNYIRGSLNFFVYVL